MKDAKGQSELEIMSRLLSAMLFIVLLGGLVIPCLGTEASVSLSQEGSLQEPFDVGKTVLYDVRLSGTSNSMLYTVELTVGPGPDSSLSRTITRDINAQGASASVQIPVNFQNSDFTSGEFGQWQSDQNRTEIWDRAWYKARITSLNPFEEPVEVEDHTGRPRLVKVYEEFKEAAVTPRTGTGSDSYTYAVSVYSSVEDNISLEIGPSRIGPWTRISSQTYSTPGSWQILKWPNVTIDFDFTSAAYRMSGRKQMTFDGPSWPIDVDFGNSSVTPERGLSGSLFDYQLEVNATKPIDVGLNVWDVSNKRYTSLGRQSYGSTRQWQRVVWKDVSPSSNPEASGLSNFYFSFYYPGSDSPFATTAEEVGKYYPGPSLAVVSLKNCSVDPANGSIFTSFGYSTWLETRLPSCEIELQTAPPGGGVWTVRGTASYNGSNNRLVWRNVSLDTASEEVGNASYRFLLGDQVLARCVGPEIDVAFKDMVYSRIGNTDRFDYKVKVRSARPSLKIELVYTDDGVIWTRSRQIQRYSSNSSEWRELSWKNQPWHKTIKFDVVRAEG